MTIKISIDLPDDELAREAVTAEFESLTNNYTMTSRIRKAVKDILIKISKEIRAC